MVRLGAYQIPTFTHMQLVIVESPSKAKTIEKYLTSEGDFKVRSSVGHVRDLPKSNKTAIDIEAGFIPHYEISKGKAKVVSDLTTLAKKADRILLATDLDREGEAIAWHLHELLKEALGKKLPEVKRITFNEITKDAVTAAVAKPREIDQDLRKAQEARRVLDRLVGYDLSGLIWKKVRYGLSAGRVQSPALRIIMVREREIRAFIPEDFWTLIGTFDGAKQQFPLTCEEEPRSKDEVNRIEKAAKSGTWSVISIKETETSRKPKAPFTTSTLQQTASTRLGFSPSRTMGAAQKLYEAGHITYMRTDSTTLGKQALAEIEKTITKEFNAELVQITEYKTKSKNAQEAHEAIRPTSASKKLAGATEDQKNLYQLIRARTLASQMRPAEIMRTKLSANISEETIPNFSTNGSRILSLGWLLADPASRGEDVEVPKLAKGDPLTLTDLDIQAKQTQPPNRYSEAGLIKELEKRGIGRPSTYAATMRTLETRGYVAKEGRTLYPTDTGDVVSSFLEEHFMEYIGDDFTADMENQLDEIANGTRDYTKTLTTFYTPFHAQVDSKEDIPKITNLGDADPKHICPDCGKAMVIKLGRGGKFLSCANYPDCTGALTIDGQKVGEDEPLGMHPESGEPIFVLSGRFGPYVQLGKADKESKEKPRRASIPKGVEIADVDLDAAVHLLILPRELGVHPESGEPVIANVGRFGPYVGAEREFRSLKKPLDPYTITLEEAVAELAKPKNLPKGVELVRVLGKHPKTGKELRLLKSKSGMYLQKGMKRIYLPDDLKPDTLTVEEAVAYLSVK